MQVTIQPSHIRGSIQAPASKSSMQRACAAALLSGGTTTIRNAGHSNDDLAALGVIAALGATVEAMDDGSLHVSAGGVHPVGNSVHCGESGLGIRMFAPIIALSDKRITINGEGSLLGRPMDFFDTVFPQLGVEVISNAGRLPLQVRGPLQPANITIDGSLSSQFLTGLLMAFAAAKAAGVVITVSGLKSRPYIDLTLGVMEQFGWKVENRNYTSFYFPGPEHHASSIRNTTYTVEGDWSGGAFLLVAGAIAGNITVKGLDANSAQADKAVLEALTSCGASLDIQRDHIAVGPGDLTAFEFDATDCPDLFPPLVSLAAYCRGTSTIKGAARLTHKESNRALTLQQEFGKMGLRITLADDVMQISPGSGLTGATVHSHHDHRIAMACAVAGLRSGGKTVIEAANAISKSYPDFYAHLQALHADLYIEQTLHENPHSH